MHQVSHTDVSNYMMATLEMQVIYVIACAPIWYGIVVVSSPDAGALSIGCIACVATDEAPLLSFQILPVCFV